VKNIFWFRVFFPGIDFCLKILAEKKTRKSIEKVRKKSEKKSCKNPEKLKVKIVQKMPKKDKKSDFLKLKPR